MVFIWTAFITGLLAGGASCAAVQGGLLAGLAARKVDRQKAESASVVGVGSESASATATRTSTVGTSVRADAMTVVVFLVGKLAAYTVLGFALGLLGKAIEITPQVQAIMLILAGLMMLVMALDLFGVKAVRAFVPTPPASWTRVVRKRSKDTGHLAPLLLGVSTVLLPCGITISMEIAAIATGSPLLGAAIMAAFVIGTVPLFFIIGFAAHRLTGAWGGRLAAVTGIAVLVAGLLAINGGLTLAGSPVTLASIAGLDKKVEGSATAEASGKQRVVIEASSSAYTPNAITAKAGVPTDLVVRGVNAAGCIRSFTVPKLGIEETIPENGVVTIPLGTLSAGRYPFSCSMGMYSGTITVVA